MDEIIGVAIKAGSTPILFAAMGSVPPSSFENMTTKIMAMATVNPITGGWWSIRTILRKLKVLSTTPRQMLTLSSFQSTLKMSLRSTSSTERPRMIRVAVWVPVLPPVPMSRGR